MFGRVCTMILLLGALLASRCMKPAPQPVPPVADAGARDSGAQDASWENPWADADLPAIDGGPDAPLDAGPQDDCSRAEAKLVELDCQRRDGGALWLTPLTETHFAVECRRALLDKPPRDWRPECIARVTKCENVDVAKRTPKGAPCPSSL